MKSAIRNTGFALSAIGALVVGGCGDTPVDPAPTVAPAIDNEPAPEPVVEPPNPAELTEFEKKLAEPVSFQFVGASATDALNYIRQSQGVNVVVDPDVAERVAKTAITVKLTEASIGAALRTLARLTGTGVQVEDNAVTITSAADGDAPPEGWDVESEAFAKKLAAKTTVNFAETPLSDIADYLGRISGANIVLVSTPGKPLPEDGISLQLDDPASARTILNLSAKLSGVDIEIRDDIVFIVGK